MDWREEIVIKLSERDKQYKSISDVINNCMFGKCRILYADRVKTTTS